MVVNKRLHECDQSTSVSVNHQAYFLPCPYIIISVSRALRAWMTFESDQDMHQRLVKNIPLTGNPAQVTLGLVKPLSHLRLRNDISSEDSTVESSHL